MLGHIRCSRRQKVNTRLEALVHAQEQCRCRCTDESGITERRLTVNGRSSWSTDGCLSANTFSLRSWRTKVQHFFPTGKDCCWRGGKHTKQGSSAVILPLLITDSYGIFFLVHCGITGGGWGGLGELLVLNSIMSYLVPRRGRNGKSGTT